MPIGGAQPPNLGGTLGGNLGGTLGGPGGMIMPPNPMTPPVAAPGM